MAVESANDRLSSSLLAALLGTEVVGIEPIDGGRNSRVFKVSTVDGSSFAAKLYSGVTADGRSRLAAEYSSLTFLRQLGLVQVPRTVCSDEDNGLACYEFIEGERITSDGVSNSDIDQATDFLLQLDSVKSGADGISSASEACFSLAQISRSIEVRLQRLQAVEETSPVHDEMKRFLAEQLKPAWDVFVTWSADHLIKYGPDHELEHNLRILSPSDFGFHNCLRKADGTLVFLDFEHFGWDDPAKMISDFLLHPAMELSHSLKARFISNLLLGLEAPDRLSNRIESVYPLFGIKWCLILLNEFHPENMRRRRLAAQNSQPDPEIQSAQLAKAQTMLNEIQASYRVFPYHD